MRGKPTPTRSAPVRRQRPPAGPRSDAKASPTASVLIGEHLAQAVQTATAGRRIGVRLVALGGHLLLRLDEPTTPGSEPHPEALYARVRVPPRDAANPRDDLVGAIERGLGELCGVDAALVRRDGDRALAVLITKSNLRAPAH